MNISPQKLLLEAENYIREIRRRKIRLLLAAAAALFLFIPSCIYLYDGINKRFLLYTFLCLGVGVFIVCPRPQKKSWSFFFVLLYLLLIPLKIFQRMELPVHDMSKIMSGATLANIFIILLLYAVLLLVSQHVNIAFGAGGIVLLLLTVINYYVNQFQGGALNFSNLLASGTALTVLDNYRLTMDSELWYSILYFCFFIAFGFWCRIPGKGIKYHCAVTSIALAYCLCFLVFWKSDYLENHNLEGTYWSVLENEELNGFLLGFGFSIRDLSIEKPDGYSASAVEEIARKAEESYQAPETAAPDSPPNIILIMNEAWSDLRVLGNLETTEPFMPYVDSLKENVIKGNLFVEILGGITANTEFEVLTGDTLAFLPASSIPYQLEVNHQMYSLARVLKEQGYQTISMHPSGGSSWYRNNVYDYFGFDRFVDITGFQTEPETVRSFISDQCNFNEIIWQYEHRRTDMPFFLFDVTIQNHGGYYGDIDDLSVGILEIGETPGWEAGDVYNVVTYLNLMKITDSAFENLVSYFEKVEEPTIICMFGDHQPLLSDNFYDAVFGPENLSDAEQTARKYITPYVIWTNYDADLPEYGDMSSNYLGAALLECAGAELPAYYKHLMVMLQQYPEISRRTIDALKEDELIKEYRILQYNHLKDKEIPNPLFSPAK